MSESLRERVARAIYESDGDAQMSVDWPGYRDTADAAIAIVLGEAEAALVKRFREIGRQECCGRGVTDPTGRYQECCGNPDLVLTVDDAAAAILALKEPKT